MTISKINNLILYILIRHNLVIIFRVNILFSTYICLECSVWYLNFFKLILEFFLCPIQISPKFDFNV